MNTIISWINSNDVDNLTTDESEDVSLLVDKVIHDAHKMLTAEVRNSNERPDKMSQLARGKSKALNLLNSVCSSDDTVYCHG